MNLKNIISNFKTAKGQESRSGISVDPLNPFHDTWFKLNRSKRNWQIVCICLFLLNFILVFSYIRLSNRVYVEPYVVFVNEKEGIIRNLGELSHIKYVPNDKIIFSVLNDHITITRTVPLDNVLYGSNIDKSFMFLSPQAQQKLLSYVEQDNVKEMFKKQQTRDVQINTILKVSNNNFQIRWTENVYSKNGALSETNKYTGIFTIDLKENNNDEKTLLVNPLGIIIKDFSYQREQ